MQDRKLYQIALACTSDWNVFEIKLSEQELQLIELIEKISHNKSTHGTTPVLKVKKVVESGFNYSTRLDDAPEFATEYDARWTGGRDSAGFTLYCNRCGNRLELDDNVRKGKGIELYVLDYLDVIEVKCSCGNETDF